MDTLFHRIILELYQLLVMYRDAYREAGEKDLDGWIGMVSARYGKRTGKKTSKRGGEGHIQKALTGR